MTFSEPSITEITHRGTVRTDNPAVNRTVPGLEHERRRFDFISCWLPQLGVRTACGHCHDKGESPEGLLHSAFTFPARRSRFFSDRLMRSLVWDFRLPVRDCFGSVPQQPYEQRIPCSSDRIIFNGIPFS